MGNEGTLKFLIRNIQLFADEEQTTSIDEALNDSDQIGEEEVQEAEKQDETETQEQEQPAGKDAKDGNSKQSRSENAEFARKRREAEKAAKEKADKENQDRLRQEYVKGKIEGIGGKNPYTGEDIVDEEDVHLYEVMKKLDDQGDDPLKGAYKALRDERLARKQERETAEQAAEQERQERETSKEQAKKVIAEFREKHPDSDFESLWKENEKFHGLIVHGYTPNEAFDLLGLQDVKQERSSTPSSAPGGGKHEKSVLDMSDDEFLAERKARYGY